MLRLGRHLLACNMIVALAIGACGDGKLPDRKLKPTSDLGVVAEADGGTVHDPIVDKADAGAETEPDLSSRPDSGAVAVCGPTNEGDVCDDGDACTQGDTCQQGTCKGLPLTCATPPKNSCADASVLTVFQTTGNCSEGTCVYQSKDETCAEGCDAATGTCAANPCQGVTCSSAPPNVCDGDGLHLISYAAAGNCKAGVCEYAENNMLCEGSCANGACQTDPCKGVSCAQPPAAACKDANTLRTYAAAGTCAGGNCEYLEVETKCVDGCAAGACLEDLCKGVVCKTPPAKSCQDIQTQNNYAVQGVCEKGICSYALTQRKCTDGCITGTCLEDACLGVTCNTPPAAYCSAGTEIAVSYSTAGTCSGAVCQYAESAVDCTSIGQICEKGSCVQPPADPCANVLCLNIPVCKNGSVYDYTGQCSNGVCEFTMTQCSDGCYDAKCLPPAGSTCSHCLPTSATCAVDGIFEQFLDGTCDSQGNCLARDVPCDSPPSAPRCIGSDTLEYYEGSCTKGDAGCGYVRKTQLCHSGCDYANGRCYGATSCTGVLCATPPQDTCKPGTNTAIQYGPQGSCDTNNGQCNYLSTEVNCEADYKVCQDGQCVADPACANLFCLASGTTCEFQLGGGAQSLSSTGQCFGGQCVVERTPCSNGCDTSTGQCMPTVAVPGIPGIGQGSCDGLQCLERRCAGGSLEIHDGTCSNGKCNYTTQFCANGCSNGACNGVFAP